MGKTSPKKKLFLNINGYTYNGCMYIISTKISKILILQILMRHLSRFIRKLRPETDF
jgi:hypothetical protein